MIIDVYGTDVSLTGRCRKLLTIRSSVACVCMTKIDHFEYVLTILERKERILRKKEKAKY